MPRVTVSNEMGIVLEDGPQGTTRRRHVTLYCRDGGFTSYPAYDGMIGRPDKRKAPSGAINDV